MNRNWYKSNYVRIWLSRSWGITLDRTNGWFYLMRRVPMTPAHRYDFWQRGPFRRVSNSRNILQKEFETWWSFDYSWFWSISK